MSPDPTKPAMLIICDEHLLMCSTAEMITQLRWLADTLEKEMASYMLIGVHLRKDGFNIEEVSKDMPPELLSQRVPQ